MSSLISSLGLTSFSSDTAFVDQLECSDGRNNVSCIEACGDAKGIFRNWPDFYTCSWYPSISRTLDESTKAGAWEGSVDLLGTKGIYGNEVALSTNISFTIANCLADYCNWSSDCQSLDLLNSCSMEHLMPSGGSIQTLNHSNAIQCLQYGICGSTANVNPDIGGLGVSQTTFKSMN